MQAAGHPSMMFLLWNSRIFSSGSSSLSTCVHPRGQLIILHLPLRRLCPVACGEYIKWGRGTDWVLVARCCVHMLHGFGLPRR